MKRAAPNPHAISEAEFQVWANRLFTVTGWLVHHDRPGRTDDGGWVTPVQGHAGFPDLIAVHAKLRRVVVAELKVGNNKPTDNQHTWLEAFAELARAVAGDAGITGWPRVIVRVWTPADRPTMEHIAKWGKERTT